ncbi:MAG: PilZ domain-containing protein [Halioglobus sp.]|nr:PilZ domain-containing protein [Halioglobus sp.]
MPEQRRKHPRLPVTSTTFIELLSARVGQNESAQLITCNTVDVSRGGLQVILSEELTVGAILQIGVDLPNAPGTLYLAGEVRWCLPSDDERHPWKAGFQILNAEDTDIATWVAMIAIMEG